MIKQKNFISKTARRKSEVTKGAFYLTKTFENLETAANGTEISRKGFQKSHARRLVLKPFVRN